jgi:large subunit ribosomal protein L1
MGTTKNVDMSSQKMEVKIVEAPKATNDKKLGLSVDTVDSTSTTAADQPMAKTTKPKVIRVRGKKYSAVKSKVDRTRRYDPLSAIELIKQLSYSKFPGTISANLKVKNLEVTGEVTLPHAAGKVRKVVVVDEQILKDIEADKLDFDVLDSSPEFMPKLAKLAKVLGPKGLMPNPKNGTLTANPAQAVKELSAGKQTLKTEKKQPLIQVPIGQTSMETKDLIENLQALLNALKDKIVQITLSPTMGPGVKVDLESF